MPSVVGGVVFMVEAVVNAVESGAAQVLRRVEPVGAPEMFQQGLVVERSVPVCRAALLGRLDLDLGEFLFLPHDCVVPGRRG
jgi:hypothetical protein